MPTISEVQITLIKSQNGLIAFAEGVVDGVLYISGIGIHQKLDGSGYRLTYPTRKIGGTSFNIFHPIKREMSLAIEQAVFAKLKDVLSKRNDRHHCADPGTSSL